MLIILRRHSHKRKPVTMNPLVTRVHDAIFNEFTLACVRNLETCDWCSSRVNFSLSDCENGVRLTPTIDYRTGLFLRKKKKKNRITYSINSLSYRPLIFIFLFLDEAAPRIFLAHVSVVSS